MPKSKVVPGSTPSMAAEAAPVDTAMSRFTDATRDVHDYLHRDDVTKKINYGTLTFAFETITHAAVAVGADPGMIRLVMDQALDATVKFCEGPLRERLGYSEKPVAIDSKNVTAESKGSPGATPSMVAAAMATEDNVETPLQLWRVTLAWNISSSEEGDYCTNVWAPTAEASIVAAANEMADCDDSGLNPDDDTYPADRAAFIETKIENAGSYAAKKNAAAICM